MADNNPMAWFSMAGDRAVTNLRGTFEDMTLKKGIRLVIIVFVYLMIRPYLMKFAGSRQMEQHEEEAARQKEREQVAAMSANEVRGLKVAAEIPDADDADIAAESSATDWGSKARKRQRKVLRKMVEAHEKKLEEEQADEEDKDIEEFLVQE